MGTKEGLLAELEQNRGQCLSGEELAGRLGVSRTAVWKAAQALRAAGYQLDATPGGGYILPVASDILSAQALKAMLGDIPLRVFGEIDSTSLGAKRWALEGAPHGALVCAERQTGGRGRRGRSFQSPPGGVYLSAVLRPAIPVADAVLVTTAAAVAVCRAVETVCGLRLSIKWVNDLFYEGRKCCGILSEAGTGVEEGSLDYVVVGIGVNYTTPAGAFPPELAPLATSLYPGGGAPAPRAVLAAAIYTELLEGFAALPDRGFLAEYRARSLVLGRPVTVLAPEPYMATALAIDDDARLVVRRAGGKEEVLSSGEISIKLEETP